MYVDIIRLLLKMISTLEKYLPPACNDEITYFNTLRANRSITITLALTCLLKPRYYISVCTYYIYSFINWHW